MAAPDFWDRQEQAQETIQQRKSMIGILEPLEQLTTGLDDFAAMIEMADEDESFAAEAAGRDMVGWKRWSSRWS